MATDVVINLGLHYKSEIPAGLTADSAALKTMANEMTKLGSVSSATSVQISQATDTTVAQAGAVQKAAGLSASFWEQQKVAATALKFAQGELNLAIVKGAEDYDLLIAKVQVAQEKVAQLAIAQEKGTVAGTATHLQTLAGPSTVPLGAQFTNDMTAAERAATDAQNAYAAALLRGDADLATYRTTARETQAALDSMTAAQLKAAEAAGIVAKTTRDGSVSLTEYNAAARLAGAGSGAFGLSVLLTRGNLALLAAALAAITVKEFADFQLTMQRVGGNTGLSADQIAHLSSVVLDLGVHSNQSFSDIATAFRHASDEGFRFGEALPIVQAGIAGAEVTGSSTADTVNTLATAMHNFHEPAVNAHQDLAIFLNAAQQGNETLEQLVTGMSKLSPLGSALGMTLTEVTALQSALTKATGNSAQSQVFAVGILTHVINPTKAAITVMQELDKTTGIDLQTTFKQFADHQISFATLMDRAKDATHGNAAEVMALFGGLRGGVGALSLINGGMADYKTTVDKAAVSQQNLNAQIEASHHTLAYKAGNIGNVVQATAISLGGSASDELDTMGKQKDTFVKNVEKIQIAYDGLLRYLGQEPAAHVKATSAIDQHIDALNRLGLAAGMTGRVGGAALRASVQPGVTVPIPTDPTAATKYGQGLQSNYSNAIAVQLDDQMKNHTTFFKADAEAVKTARDELDRYQKLQYEAEGPQRKFTASLSAAARQLDEGFTKFGAPEATVTGQIDELKHQSALIGLNTSLSQEQRTLQQAQLQVEMDLRQIALDTLKEQQLQNSPTATPEQRAQASQTVTNDFSKLGEDRVAAGNAGQAVVAKAVQDGFSRQERGISAQMVELQHQSTMIGLNTSLSADQKAILQDSKQIQIDQKQIQLDTLKLSADIALGKSGKANLPADRVAIQTDRNTLDEHQQQKTNDVATNTADAIQAHFTKLEGLQTAQINALQHQSVMVGLSTTMTAEQKAVAQAALQVQIDQRQILLDGLMLQAAIASKDPKAIAGARSALQQDTYKEQEDAAHLKNAKATDEATRAIQRWTLETGSHTQKADEALAALALGIRNHDTPAQLEKLAQSAANAQSSVNGDGTAHQRATDMVTALLDPGMKLAGIFKQIADSGQSAADFLTKTFGQQGAQHVFGFGGFGVTGSQLEHANDPKTPPITQADITTDITTKDWSKAASDNTAAFEAGTITQKEYIANQQAINQHTADWNKKVMDADVAMGDFTGALQIGTKAYHDGSMSFTDYVALLKKSNAQNAGNAKADWLANYAAGDPSTQRSMMNTALQPMMSQQSTIQSATGAVDSANLQVIAANSALTVAKITDATTAITDLSGIMSAQAGEVTAQYQGQIAAINDGSAILQAKSQDQLTQFATLQTIAKDTASGTAQQVALDRQLLAAQQKTGADAVRVAELTAQMNQSIARDQLTVARDNVKQAQDKMSVDAANAAAQGTVLMDQLAVAKDNYQLAVDQKQLTMDTLPILEDIAYQLGSDQPYADQVTKDLNAVAGDEKQAGVDQQKLGNDQASANQIAASGGLLLAGDQSQTGSDQIGATKDQQIWDLQIAEAKAQQAQDTVLVSTIQANISALQANTATIANSTAASQTLEKALRDALNQAYQPGSRKYVGSSSTANNLFGSLATQGRMGGM